MSKFFKALEQAERERALREQPRPEEANPTGLVSCALAASRQDPGSPAHAPVVTEPAPAPPVVEAVFYPSLASATQRFIS